MGCGIRQRQINQMDRALGTMTRAGIPSLADPFRKVFELRGQVFRQVGLKLPRTIIQLIRLVALSPGSITLWLDVEAGWMSEGREKPGAPPVYRWPTDEQAMMLLKGELTKELELELLKPDEYLGE